MSRIGRVQDASHGMYAPMTPAQGKYLTNLLNQATARNAHVGNTVRAATHEMYAGGTLTKDAASTWINCLKRFLDTPGSTATADLDRQVRSARSRALRGPAPVGVQVHGAPAVRPAHGPTPLTDSVRAACAKVGVKQGQSRRTGSGVPTHGPNRTMALIGAMGRPSTQEAPSDAPF